MSTSQFRTFLAAVIVVVLVGAGYLVWHTTHPATSHHYCTPKPPALTC